MVKVDRLERKGRHSHYTEIFITSVDLSLFAISVVEKINICQRLKAKTLPLSLKSPLILSSGKVQGMSVIFLK